MTERGIRIRCSTEQYWSAVEDEVTMALPEDEEPMEDELQFLRDRQEMKPY